MTRRSSVEKFSTSLKPGERDNGTHVDLARRIFFSEMDHGSAKEQEGRGVKGQFDPLPSAFPFSYDQTHAISLHVPSR